MTNPESDQEELWIAEQRKRVVEFLRIEEVDHLGVGDCPAFHVHPCLALWAVQSKKASGTIGWWAISGDVPTDYISGVGCAHPREALREFSRYWHEVAEYMLRGERHSSVTIGKSDRWPELGNLLRTRAEILHEWASDGQIWDRDELRQA